MGQVWGRELRCELELVLGRVLVMEWLKLEEFV
jgi:hypothetical protein